MFFSLRSIRFNSTAVLETYWEALLKDSSQDPGKSRFSLPISWLKFLTRARIEPEYDLALKSTPKYVSSTASVRVRKKA